MNNGCKKWLFKLNGYNGPYVIHGDEWDYVGITLEILIRAMWAINRE